MEYLFVILCLSYFVLILSFIIGFDSYEEFTMENKVPTSHFSILIPFRNEAENLPYLLESIKQLAYPRSHFEVILINDFSTDNFQEIITEFEKKNPEISLKLLKNKLGISPKKTAITLGVKNAKHSFIATTDADCILPKNWLKGFDCFIQKNNPSMICAPVAIQQNNNLVSKFEALNFSSLQGSTIGSFGIQKPFLCNGANLCYSKKVFEKVHGFSGNEKIASGDDIFLLEKFLVNDKNNVHFLKSEHVLIKTKGQENFKSFLQQQVRWAKKSSAYKNKTAKIIGGLVFLTNLILLLSIILAIFDLMHPITVVIGFLFKLLADYILISKTNSFARQQHLDYFIFPSSILYPLFMLMVGLAALGNKYEWKDRKFER